MKLRELNRFQAFAGHLLISCCIAVVSSILVFFLWYPGLLANAAGVENIYLILLGVDVVLGPLITLIIFNVKKKELKFDLFVIGMVQLCALLYGVHTVFIARPIFVVYNVDRFDIVRANDLPSDALEKAQYPDFRTEPFFGPQVVAALLPESNKERKELLFNSISGGSDLAQLPQYYVPYSHAKSEILKHLQPMEKLSKNNEGSELAIKSILDKYKKKGLEVSYLPLKGKAVDLTVIVNSQTSEVLEFSKLKPW